MVFHLSALGIVINLKPSMQSWAHDFLAFFLLITQFEISFQQLTPNTFLYGVPQKLPSLNNPYETFLTPPTFPPVEPIHFNDLNSFNKTIKPISLDIEALMNVPEIVNHWGYPVEIHDVVTEDGYILQLHRIPYGKNDTNQTSNNRPVVFLQHGLLCTSSIWLLNLPHQSAGFVFADSGFDVWLGNMRGNIYSKEHTNYSSSESRFWRFSWEEMAKYDLPAMIDYVLKKTDKPFLYYVGHSQGTLTMFAQLSRQPEFKSKIRKMFALAPVARMSNVHGLFHYLGKIYEQFNLVYALFGDNEFMSNNIFTRMLTDIICDVSVNNPICENFIFSVSGPNSNQLNSTRIGIFLAHNPAGTSVRNMLHFAQMVRRRSMSAFDLGLAGNLKTYGKAEPPEYKLDNVEASMYLFYSDYDWLANSVDVEGHLMKSLPKTTVKLAKKLYKFNHNDFLWGLRARKEIYDPIVNIIKLDDRRLKIQRNLSSFLDRKGQSLRKNDSTKSSNSTSE
ncbi:unnamed protein product [Auanema sp. JU1783]|nr:unnamed protein product [Auanema sp. JU1783]